MARLRTLGDRAHRPVIGARVIFGDPDDQAGDGETDDRTQEQVHPGEADHLLGSAFLGQWCAGIDPGHAASDLDTHSAEGITDDEIDQRDRQHRGNEEALVHCPHDIGAALAELDEVGPDDAGDDARAADKQGQRHHRHEQFAQRRSEQDRGQNHGDAYGDDIGLEEVCRHPGAIADIVADIVRDHCGIARIVLGDACFDLADEIGADVGGLGEDPAAETREDRDERGAEGEADEAVDHFVAIGGIAGRADEVPEEHRDREQRETCHQHAGDRPCTKGEGKTLLQPALCGGSGTHVGAHRDVHPDEAGDTRKDRADDEADCRHGAQKQEHQHGDADADDTDGRVLALEIGLRAFLDCAGDFLHLFIAGTGAQYLAAGDEAVHDGQKSQHNCYEN